MQWINILFWSLVTLVEVQGALMTLHLFSNTTLMCNHRVQNPKRYEIPVPRNCSGSVSVRLLALFEPPKHIDLTSLPLLWYLELHQEKQHWRKKTFHLGSLPSHSGPSVMLAVWVDVHCGNFRSISCGAFGASPVSHSSLSTDTSTDILPPLNRRARQFNQCTHVRACAHTQIK